MFALYESVFQNRRTQTKYMKKLIGILVSVAVAAVSFAQEGKTGKENPYYPYNTENITPQEQGAKEYYVVHNNKVWHIDRGVSTEITNDIFLSNGTKITPEGKMFFKDGRTEILEDGQCIDIASNVSFCEMPPQKKLEPEKKQEENLPEDRQKNKKIEPGK